MILSKTGAPTGEDEEILRPYMIIRRLPPLRNAYERELRADAIGCMDIFQGELPRPDRSEVEREGRRMDGAERAGSSEVGWRRSEEAPTPRGRGAGDLRTKIHAEPGYIGYVADTRVVRPGKERLVRDASKDLFLEPPEGVRAFSVERRDVDVEYAHERIGLVLYTRCGTTGGPGHASSNADLV